MKTWNGKDLNGWWTITRKLDGVQAIYDAHGKVMSRRGKPLYNLPKMPEGVYEVYIKSWEETVSRVRTHAGIQLEKRFLYRISNPLDKRLVIKRAIGRPTADLIRGLFKQYLRRGDEGLVLHPWPHHTATFDKRNAVKVKTKETYDVKVLSVKPGKGKHAGRMGALYTGKGKVGTGFSDEQRSLDWTRLILSNTMIEVESTGLTPGGKFRHARFVRIREDK